MYFLPIESAVLYINPFECEAAVNFFISLQILLRCDPFVSTYVDSLQFV